MNSFLFPKAHFWLFKNLQNDFFLKTSGNIFFTKISFNILLKDHLRNNQELLKIQLLESMKIYFIPLTFSFFVLVST